MIECDFFILKRYPFILHKFDIGSCQEKWTTDYLASKIGSKPGRIHVSKDPMMDFVRKRSEEFILRNLVKDLEYSDQLNYLPIQTFHQGMLKGTSFIQYANS